MKPKASTGCPKAKAEWRLRNPWARFVEWARRRCNDTTSKRWWPYYGAKGITCHLTAAELKEIWERDGAAKMKRASLDRKNPEWNYTNWNCRFLEFKLNSRLAWDPDAKISEEEYHRQQAAQFA